MRDRVFIDTNVLIYAYSEDEPEKRTIANRIIRDNAFISLQVINEFSNILLKKFHIDTTLVEETILELDSVLTIKPFTLMTQIKALHLKKRYGFQYYDALIVAAALENHCDILFSEDMQDRQIIEGKLQIINPFKK